MKYGNTIVSSSDKPGLQFLADYCASENMQQNGKVRRHNIPKRKFNAQEFTCIDLSKWFEFLSKIALLNDGRFETQISKVLKRHVFTRHSFLNSNCNANLSHYRHCFDIVCGYPLSKWKIVRNYIENLYSQCVLNVILWSQTRKN